VRSVIANKIQQFKKDSDGEEELKDLDKVRLARRNVRAGQVLTLVHFSAN
jgi:hypothetical protein